MRLALGIEYFGSPFRGWQSQAGGGTVQDALEAALAKIAGQPGGRPWCAGRTDAGVHAIQQVVHFDAPVERPLSAWVRGVNTHLPDGVAVRWAQPVSDEFHARFSAHGRRYRYLLLNRRSGRGSGRAGWAGSICRSIWRRCRTLAPACPVNMTSRHSGRRSARPSHRSS